MSERDKKLRAVWGKKSLGQQIGQHERDFFPLFLEVAQRCRSILDVGAGSGRMIKILQDSGVDADFVALDFTTQLLQSPGQRVLGDARQLPFQNSAFDLVYSLGVVEHFPETEIAIKEHARVVKKGGYVFVSVPHLNVATPLRYLRYLAYREFREGSFQIMRGSNLRLSKLEQLFKEVGLNIAASDFAGQVIFPRRFPFGLAAGCLQTLSCLSPFSLRAPFIYVLGRKV